jgi:hypothetical protein
MVGKGNPKRMVESLTRQKTLKKVGKKVDLLKNFYYFQLINFHLKVIE